MAPRGSGCLAAALIFVAACTVAINGHRDDSGIGAPVGESSFAELGERIHHSRGVVSIAAHDHGASDEIQGAHLCQNIIKGWSETSGLAYSGRLDLVREGSRCDHSTPSIVWLRPDPAPKGMRPADCEYINQFLDDDYNRLFGKPQELHNIGCVHVRRPQSVMDAVTQIGSVTSRAKLLIVTAPGEPDKGFQFGVEWFPGFKDELWSGSPGEEGFTQQLQRVVTLGGTVLLESSYAGTNGVASWFSEALPMAWVYAPSSKLTPPSKKVEIGACRPLPIQHDLWELVKGPDFFATCRMDTGDDNANLVFNSGSSAMSVAELIRLHRLLQEKHLSKFWLDEFEKKLLMLPGELQAVNQLLQFPLKQSRAISKASHEEHEAKNAAAWAEYYGDKEGAALEKARVARAAEDKSSAEAKYINSLPWVHKAATNAMSSVNFLFKHVADSKWATLILTFRKIKAQLSPLLPLTSKSNKVIEVKQLAMQRKYGVALKRAIEFKQHMRSVGFRAKIFAKHVSNIDKIRNEFAWLLQLAKVRQQWSSIETEYTRYWLPEDKSLPNHKP